MHKRYKIRHKIIEYLNTKVVYKDLDIPSLENAIAPLQEIATKINEKYEDVFKYHQIIPDTQAKCVVKDKQHCMYLLRGGIDAYVDEYWLREGQKEANDRIYDKVKWVVPIIALLITAGSLGYSIYSIRDTQSKVSRIERQMIEHQRQLKNLTDTLNKHSQKR